MMFSPTAPLGYTPTPRTGRATAVARAWWIVLSLIGGVGALGLQFIITLTRDRAGGFVGLLGTLSYFTILSNIIVLAVAIGLAVNPRRDDAKFRWLLVSALVQITITGLVYITVLAPAIKPGQEPQGWQAVANYCQHYIVPAMMVLGWLLFGPRRRMTWGVVLSVIVIPLIWLAYTLIHGALAPGFFAYSDPPTSYPYPFLDVDELGYVTVLVNVIFLSLAGLALAAVFLGVDRLLTKSPTAADSADSAAKGA